MSPVIHIGMHKTGSTMLQAILANNIPNLNEAGFNYPRHSSFSRASLGHATQGNGALVMQGDFRFARNTLLSSESFYVDSTRRSTLISKMQASRLDFKVIMYVRDVFDHSTSSWNQRVKGGEETLDLDEFLETKYGDQLEDVLWWLENKDQLGIDLKVANYSNHSMNLAEHFLTDMLGVSDISKFDLTMDSRQINRSLTRSELEVQRILNHTFPQNSARSFGVSLINELPDMHDDKVLPSEQAFTKLVSRIGPLAGQINEHLDIGEQISLQYPKKANNLETSSTTVFIFSRNQLEVLVSNFCRMDSPRAFYWQLVRRLSPSEFFSTLRELEPGRLKFVILSILKGKWRKQ